MAHASHVDVGPIQISILLCCIFFKKSLNLITQGYTINIDVATPSSKNQYQLGRAWQNKMALIGPNFLNVSLIF
jgi:hypothetical protein